MNSDNTPIDTNNITLHTMNNGEKTKDYKISTYIIIWLQMLMLTGLMVTLSGVNLGIWSTIGIVLIGSLNCSVIIGVFMNIKPKEGFFKIMLVLAIALLAVITLAASINF